MQAGNLNRKITIQKRVQGQSPSGQPIDEWQDVTKVWAWVKTQSGMAVARQTGESGGVAMSLNSYSFRVRFRPDITDDMRIVYGGLYFDIQQVRHDLAGHIWTDLVTEQGGSEG
ncbi:phage head closure protein [Castellaniella ginsengisoli]|uniref:Phage head closure protein n=1 Tax=Castellaniella ginsengisoli TaxID=546114 RepID=A0AB39ENQ2_9BURK